MKKVSKKMVIIISVYVLIALGICSFSKQIVNAEENTIIKADSIVEGALIKYINNKVSETDKETLVQYHLRTGIKYEEGQENIPIKEKETNINFKQIDGKYPSRVTTVIKSTKATNGNSNDNTKETYSYDSKTGILKINISNQNEKGEAILKEKISENDRDEYIIICHYDTYTEEKPQRDISLNVLTKTTLFTNDNKEISKQGILNITGKENVGNLTSTNYKTEDIYNGYIKSNIINNTNYNTNYKEMQEITISKKEMQQNIKIIENNTFEKHYKDKEEKEIVEELGNNGSLIYKSTRISKDNMKEILGEEGKIEILDSNDKNLATIDSKSQFAEDGNITVTYNENIEELRIKTSNIQNEGILYFENTKKIKDTMHNIENTKIKTTTKIVGLNEEKIAEKPEDKKEIEVYTYNDQNTIELKDTKTNVKLDIDNSEWTNKQQNEVNFDIYLDSTSMKNNMLKNPTIEIKLPKNVEKVILNNNSIIYNNGLNLENTYIQTDGSGNHSIIAQINGEQNEYNSNELATNVKISATIILKKDIESSKEKLNLIYTNNYAINNKEEQGNIEKDINIQSYNEPKQSTKIESIANNLSTQNVLDMNVTSKKGETTLNNNDVIYEGEYIKYSVKLTNTTNADMENVKVVGMIPDGLTYGELIADYYSYQGDYKYEFDKDLREKTIDVGTIKAGESYELFYEVQTNDLVEGESQKEITTNIKSYIGESEVANYDIKNIIQPSEVKVFMDAKKDGGEGRWNYGIYLQGEAGKKVTVTIKLPKEFTLEMLAFGGDYLRPFPNEYATVSEDNVVTANLTIGKAEIFLFEGRLEDESFDKTTKEKYKTLIANANVTVEGNTYTSNENRILYEFQDIEILMTSPTEGEEVKYEEEIEYNISIKNTGNKNTTSELSKVIPVNVKDFLPKGVKPQSITYDKWNYPLSDTEQVLTKTEETKDISNILEDENGNKLPNVDLLCLVPYEETINIKIKTTAEYLYEKTVVENKASITSTKLVTEEQYEKIVYEKTSNTISHTILPANFIPPEEPEEPEEPENPDNPQSKKYNISGVAWLDENEDGQRQESEKALSDIKVMLVDMKNRDSIKTESKTDSKGEYRLTEIEEGEYVVLFQYNNNIYTLTHYNKNGVSSKVNSDVFKQEKSILGENVAIAATDKIELKSNVSNIDIGLIKNKKFDLNLNKTISKVTVQTNKRSAAYDYEKEKLAKIEIKAKEIEGAKVTVEYEIVISNEGDIAGTVGKVIDYIPEGFNLSTDSSKTWMKQKNNELVNASLANKKIEPGEKVTLKLTAIKTMTENSTGIFKNTAEIGEASNIKNVEDIDSTPGNNSQNEDDFSKAEIIISIDTGIGMYISIGIMLLITIVLFIGIKKGKIKIGKVSKIGLFVIIFTTMIFAQYKNSIAASPPGRTQFYWGGFGAYPQFSGSYFGVGFCMDHGIYTQDQYGDERGYDLARSEVNHIGSSEETTGRISLSKGNSKIITKEIDGNYNILGPFVINCNNNNGYSFEMYNNNGGGIYGFATCDSNGNGMDVRGNSTFYLKIPKTACDKGISKVKVQNNANISTRVTNNYTIYGEYNPVIGQAYAQRVSSPNGESVYNRKVISEVSQSSRNVSASVEWTGFSGGLDIIKQDADNSNIKLPGVQIRVENSAVGYDKTFTTDSKGRIHIENLSIGNYKITEVFNGNYGYEKIEKGQITVYGGQIAAFTLVNEKQTGNLSIVKVDTDKNSIAIPGVKFKIKDSKGKYVIAIDSKNQAKSKVEGTIHLGNMKTTDKVNEATEFITDKNGKIKVFNILIDTYQVIETSIGDNFGYDVDNEYITWNTSSGTGKGNPARITVKRQTSSNTGSNVNQNDDNILSKLTIKNRRKYIKISGFAWEDMIEGKTSKRDDKYNSSVDKRLKNIPVSLYNANNQIIATNITNENGQYKFGNYDQDKTATKVKIDDLQGAYLKFEYNGMSYETVPINSKFNITSKETGKYSIDGIDNSSSDLELRDAFNNNYASISKDGALNQNGQHIYNIKYKSEDYKSTVIYGDNVKYGYEGQRFPITGVYGQYSIQATTNRDTDKVLCTGFKRDDIRRNGVEEITNINLGLKEREQPDLATVQKEAENVILSLNGYDHTYKYSTDKTTDKYKQEYMKEFDYAVKLGKKRGEQSFTREIYESDISYNPENKSDQLQAYVTYKVQIVNESTSLPIICTELMDYFDNKYSSNKGDIKASLNLKENGRIDDDEKYLVNVSESEKMNDEYSKVVLTKKDGILVNPINKPEGQTDEEALNAARENINSGNSIEVYIQFKVKDEAIKLLLEDNNKEVMFDNIAEIGKYTTYKNGKIYAGIDKDSAPQNVKPSTNPEDSKSYEDDTSISPAFKIVQPAKLSEDARILTGAVFEDNENLSNTILTNQSREGNGIYNVGAEHGIGEVDIELKEQEKSDDKAMKYVTKTVTETGKYGIKFTTEPTLPSNSKEIPAGTKVILTPEKYVEANKGQYKYIVENLNEGDYFIKGYIPGKYKLTYTWGGQTYTTDAGEKTTYTVQDYKGTIYKDEEHSEKYWYKDNVIKGDVNFDSKLTKEDSVEILKYVQKEVTPTNEQKLRADVDNDGKVSALDVNMLLSILKGDIDNPNDNKLRYSDAIDNYATREEIDNEIKELEDAAKEGYNKTKMDSTTSQMEFNFEYTDNQAKDNKLDNYVAIYKIKNVDFGIVERPRQAIEAEKRISHIKLTLPNGMIIADADVEKNGKFTGQANGLVYTPADNTHKYGSIKMELDNELVHSSTLEITYSLRIDNISEKDYITEEFYKYGSAKKPNIKDIIKITPIGVYDYLDAEMSTNDSDWKIITQTEYNGAEEVDYITKTEYKTSETIVAKDENGNIISRTYKWKEGETEKTGSHSEYLTYLKEKRTVSLVDRKILKDMSGKLQTPIEPGKHNETTLLASKVLSVSDEIELENNMEVTKVKKDKGRPISESESKWEDGGETTIPIPPTGENKNIIIYTIIGVTALIILGIGIVIIKKKIL